MTKQKQKLRLRINTDGSIQTIYNDNLMETLSKIGTPTTTRVSNVEPCEGGWSAEIHNGPVLGPFPRRDQALEAEVDYLNKKLFGV